MCQSDSVKKSAFWQQFTNKRPYFSTPQRCVVRFIAVFSLMGLIEFQLVSQWKPSLARGKWFGKYFLIRLTQCDFRWFLKSFIDGGIPILFVPSNSFEDFKSKFLTACQTTILTFYLGRSYDSDTLKSFRTIAAIGLPLQDPVLASKRYPYERLLAVKNKRQFIFSRSVYCSLNLFSV